MKILKIPIILYIRNFPTVEKNSSFGLIEQLKINRDIFKGNWDQVEEKLLQLTPSQLTRVINGLCTEKEYVKYIEHYVNTPQTEIQNLLAGVHCTNTAWAIRTGRWAKDVSMDKWEGFLKYLGKADECLSKNFSQPIIQQEVLGRKLRVDMGMSRKSRAEATYKKSIEINPNHFLTNIAYFNLMTPKWLGDKEALQDFVLSPKSKAISQLLQLMHLVELYLNSDKEEEDLATTKMRFQSDYQTSFEKLLIQLQIPDDDSMETIYSKNYLAFLYNIFNRTSERDKLFIALKKRFTYLPWCYLGFQSEKEVKLAKLGGLL